MRRKSDGEERVRGQMSRREESRRAHRRYLTSNRDWSTERRAALPCDAKAGSDVDVGIVNCYVRIDHLTPRYFGRGMRDAHCSSYQYVRWRSKEDAIQCPRPSDVSRWISLR